MSQSALAAASGVDPATIGRIERGETRKPNKIAPIQKALGIGPYAARESSAGRAAETMTNAELAAQYWQKVDEIRDLVSELSHVGAVMARRLPQDPAEPGPSSTAARFDATEYAQDGGMQDRA